MTFQKNNAFRGFLLSHGEVWAHTLGDPGASPYKTAEPIRPWLCARGTSEVPPPFFAIFGIIFYNKEITNVKMRNCEPSCATATFTKIIHTTE